MICIGEDDPGLFLEYWQLEEETLKSALMDPLFNGHTVIAYEGANDALTWINLIKKHQCTIFIGVPAIYRQIIQKTDFTLDDCPSLRYCMSAGEHLSASFHLIRFVK